ncbi:alcohol dehydrogenase catalytic domain-containing protein [Candidatus Marsarchaeota archaeon]|jgi:NADPH:quinone reductase-like Zn-dependent oxidoreductase|nr:alcohol dehydrogenase catalytic domain-containing protein [Candidatus Marsarchaeota archaeon]
MKALIFDKQGTENLKIADLERPEPKEGEVLIKIAMAGVNPIDKMIINAIPGIKPMPHIAGAEFAGTVEAAGQSVKSLKPGDRVTVFNRYFDGTCDMCSAGMEMLCRNGYITGVMSDGGFAEYIAVNERNAVKIPDGTGWEMAASLPVAALTPYHAVNRAGLSKGETAVILGASGNTGRFALQFAKEKGARVIAVSRKSSMADFGADETVSTENAIEKISEITKGRMADFVLNSLGEKFWNESFSMLGSNSRLATFGTLTGPQVSLDLSGVYSKHATIIGSTGGSMHEFKELASKSPGYKLKVWKKFRLEEGQAAINGLSSSDRDGRVMLQIS